MMILVIFIYVSNMVYKLFIYLWKCNKSITEGTRYAGNRLSVMYEMQMATDSDIYIINLVMCYLIWCSGILFAINTTSLNH